MTNIQMMKEENIHFYRDFIQAYENLNGMDKWFEGLRQDVLKEIIQDSFTYGEFLMELNGTYYHKNLLPLLMVENEMM